MKQIPEKSQSREELLKILEDFKANDVDWKSGRSFGFVYDPGKEAMEFGKEAFLMYMTENGLDFTAFPSLLRFESELASMCAAHVGGDENVVGNFTSGGTESIMLAVKSARDYYRKYKPEIREPEIILPITGHAAFHKAAHYLCLKITPVPVRDHDLRADPEAVRRAINPNTIMIVGSSPGYAHGVIDPISELASIASENDLWMHVDGCVGGFMLPYYRRLGRDIPDFDFSVPGVTSLSMDLHKYAYTPKGASMVLYRNKKYRKSQIFACADWTGYAIVNNAIQSAKSGGPMAAAWAMLHYMGDEGYMEIARRKIEATDRIAAGIQAIPELKILSNPDMSMLAFTSDDINIFLLIDEVNSRGWYIQPQLRMDNSPEAAHISVNFGNVGLEEEFLKDLRECVEKVKGQEASDLVKSMSGVLDGLDPDALDDDAVSEMMSMAGVAGDSLPGSMADINMIMNMLPRKLRGRLLVEYVNDLFIYKE